MEEERVILSEEKVPAIMLGPRGTGRKVVTAVSLIIGKVIGEVMVDSMRGHFVKSVLGTDELCDFRDLVDSWRAKANMTLTNKNLILTWRQGTFTKKDKGIALPVKYMKGVAIRGTTPRAFCIDFEVPNKETNEPILFDIKVIFTNLRWTGRDKEEKWRKEILNIISTAGS